jgi:hypothetical protein
MMSTPSRLGGLQTPSFEQARRQWYHWFQATERGADSSSNFRSAATCVEILISWRG